MPERSFNANGLTFTAPDPMRPVFPIVPAAEQGQPLALAPEDSSADLSQPKVRPTASAYSDPLNPWSEEKIRAAYELIQSAGGRSAFEQAMLHKGKIEGVAPPDYRRRILEIFGTLDQARAFYEIQKNLEQARVEEPLLDEIMPLLSEPQMEMVDDIGSDQRIFRIGDSRIRGRLPFAVSHQFLVTAERLGWYEAFQFPDLSSAGRHALHFDLDPEDPTGKTHRLLASALILDVDSPDPNINLFANPFFRGEEWPLEIDPTELEKDFEIFYNAFPELLRNQALPDLKAFQRRPQIGDFLVGKDEKTWMDDDSIPRETREIVRGQLEKLRSGKSSGVNLIDELDELEEALTKIASLPSSENTELLLAPDLQSLQRFRRALAEFHGNLAHFESMLPSILGVAKMDEIIRLSFDAAAVRKDKSIYMRVIQDFPRLQVEQGKLFSYAIIEWPLLSVLRRMEKATGLPCARVLSRHRINSHDKSETYKVLLFNPSIAQGFTFP